MEPFFFKIVKGFLGNGITEILIIIFLIVLTIGRIKKIRINNKNLYKNKLQSHALLNYIEYINKYRIKNVYHEDKGREAIMRTLLKCFVDALYKNVKEFLEETKNKDFNKKTPKEVITIVNNYTDEFIKEFKMLFKEKAEKSLDSKDIERILSNFKEENTPHITSLGKIIFDISNNEFYRNNNDVAISILDLTLSAVIQVSLNIEYIFSNINGSLIGKEFRGIIIQK